ncbi:DUF3905 domain-containing protein [Paenibacillus thermoaerophilus]|jgi:hypothetical protein|uniref:DUF3905 domain-containing protein n=1 Tax=Paenibacillus thermoaerophilus TaxID=1215385 RepID=A0ABW2V002_9BACL|nr:DUF3905 domain-containing protein [Paenibacillus thermoaerophilus]TMV18256.1 DUF3905 domain-containing protein [Paenibacillus thermoaerophilus]
MTGQREDQVPDIPDDGYKGVRPAKTRDDPSLDPYELEFRPEFREGRGPQGPFVNSYGVVIGDRDYESPNSPLEQWSRDTDPAVMAGEGWVHPFKDVGFSSAENRELFEQGIPPGQPGAMFMHPDKNTAYGAYRADNGKDES